LITFDTFSKTISPKKVMLDIYFFKLLEYIQIY